MYGEYAHDPRMKANIGIRRRLAPLLDNSPRNWSCSPRCSFAAGLPVPLLRRRDRDGRQHLARRPGQLRTPDAMDAGPERGLFQRDPARLYLPVMMDAMYGYQALNVEAQDAQQRFPAGWTRRMIEIRKRHPVFALGSYEELSASQPERARLLRPREGDDRPAPTSCSASTTSPASRSRSSSTCPGYARPYAGGNDGRRRASRTSVSSPTC